MTELNSELEVELRPKFGLELQSELRLEFYWQLNREINKLIYG